MRSDASAGFDEAMRSRTTSASASWTVEAVADSKRLLQPRREVAIEFDHLQRSVSVVRDGVRFARHDQRVGERREARADLDHRVVGVSRIDGAHDRVDHRAIDEEVLAEALAGDVDPGAHRTDPRRGDVAKPSRSTRSAAGPRRDASPTTRSVGLGARRLPGHGPDASAPRRAERRCPIVPSLIDASPPPSWPPRRSPCACCRHRCASSRRATPRGRAPCRGRPTCARSAGRA